MKRTDRFLSRIDDDSSRRTAFITLNFLPPIVLQIFFEFWDKFDGWNGFTTRSQAIRHVFGTKTFFIVKMIVCVFDCCWRIVDILDMLLSDFCVVLVLLSDFCVVLLLLKYWSMLICRLIDLNGLIIRLIIPPVLLYGKTWIWFHNLIESVTIREHVIEFLLLFRINILRNFINLSILLEKITN